MKKLLLFLVIIFSSLSLSAQKINGSATFKTAGSIPMKLESAEITPEQKKRIEERMSKAMQKEYTLSFNRNESLYEEVVALEKDGQRGMRFLSMMTGASGTYYRNLKESTIKQEQDLFGKLFLIEDSIETLEWKLGKETKSIGNYICNKATAERVFVVSKTEMIEGEVKDTIINDTVEIVAWYSMQIPVSHGPGKYSGLPGLILEVYDGQTTVLCTKVSISTTEAAEIKIPENGEQVSRSEFEKISREKMEEMREMYGGSRGGRGGHGSMEIRIGG
ncbi:MAG: GLPGLI family protein [Bacteroidetes bacterium]|nr:MAG: GLPGLI family protein [Bacteroidota bacterium]